MHCRYWTVVVNPSPPPPPPPTIVQRAFPATPVLSLLLQRRVVATATADRIRFGRFRDGRNQKLTSFCCSAMPHHTGNRATICHSNSTAAGTDVEVRLALLPAYMARSSLSSASSTPNLTLSGTSWIKKERKNHPCFNIIFSPMLTRQDSENIDWAQWHFPQTIKLNRVMHIHTD